MDLKAIEDHLATHFGKHAFENKYNGIKAAALKGQIVDWPVRSLCWKLFLNLVPSDKPLDQWTASLEGNRMKYTELVEKYDVHPEDSEENLAVNNPLSQEEDSPWQTFWENEELKKEINKDVERTHQEHDFFKRPDVLEHMLQILFVWAKLNPRYGYRQGMNEILAPFLLVVDREKLVNRTNSDAEVLFDADFVENDCFLLFTAVMNIADEWFEVRDAAKPPAKNVIVGRADSLLGKAAGISQQSSNTEAHDAHVTAALTPVLLMAQRIQGGILKQHDPQLHAQLKSLGIEPQLYSLRWVRLMLSREFHLEDVLKMWDAIFADSADLNILPYVCAAMLRFVREYLLSADYLKVMKRLLKFPPVEDVSSFVEQAILMRDGRERAVVLFPAVKSAIAASVPKKTVVTDAAENEGFNHTLPNGPVKVSDLQKDRITKKLGSFPHPHLPRKLSLKREKKVTPSEVLFSVEPEAPELPQKSPENELLTLQRTVVRQGERLDGLVATLQREIFTPEGMDTGVVAYALAELKQIRDILSLTINDSTIEGEIMEKGVVDKETTEKAAEKGAAVLEVETDPLGVAVFSE